MTEVKTAALPRKDAVGLILAGGAGSITGVLPALVAPVYSIWLADVHHLSNTDTDLVQSSLH